MLADDTIRDALRAAWHLPPDGCTRLAGGMNSATWLVNVGPQRFVAKLVPYSERVSFAAGLAAAEHLARHDVDAGVPVRSVDGALTTALTGTGSPGSPQYVLALLRFVAGRSLDRADPVDQRWWGDRLAAVHRLLLSYRHPGLRPWHWLRPDAAHLSLEPWLRPAIIDALAGLTRLQVTDVLTFGVLHGDPVHDAFRLDPATGRIGVVDWGSAGIGPLLYDVASAVMYAGGPDLAGELLDAYASAAVVPVAELESALATLLRFRWAVQADYFAARIVADDRTGLSDPAENHTGLRHARAVLLR